MAHKLLKGEYKVIKGLLDDNPFSWKGEPFTISYVSLKTTNLLITRFSYKEPRRRRYNPYGVKTIRRDTVSSVAISDKVAFYVNDLDIGSHVRCKQVMQLDDKIEAVYLISGNASDIKLIQEELGMIKPIPLVSSIKRDKKARVAAASISEVNPLNSVQLLKYDNTDGRYKKPATYWKKDKYRVANGGVYVCIDRYKIAGMNPESYIREYESTLSLIGENLEDIDVIGAKYRTAEKLRHMDNWITLADYVRKRVRSYLKLNDFSKEVAWDTEYQSLKNMTCYDNYRFFLKDIDVDENSVLGEFITTVDKVQESIKDIDVSTHRTLAYRHGDEEVKIEKVGLLDLWEAVIDAYPLLSSINSVYSNKDKIKEYIKAMDYMSANSTPIEVVQEKEKIAA